MKNFLVTILILLALTLTACGSTSTALQSATVAPAGSLPQATLLIVGTFKLDGTENAVTAEQAKELLPLWQVYNELLTSDTATQEERDGLVAQIQETMNADQMQAMQDMNLTQQDVMAVMQEQGAGVSSAMKDASNSATSNTGGGGPPDAGGGMPMGAPPDDGGGMPAGGQAASADSSSSAGSVSSPAGSGQSSLWVEALIKYLQSI